MPWPWASVERTRARLRRRLEAMPVTPLVALRPGTQARVTGVVRRYDGPERLALATLRSAPLRTGEEVPIAATHSGRTCVYVASHGDYRYGGELRRTAGVLFVLTDSHGAAVVDLRHAHAIDPLEPVVARPGEGVEFVAMRELVITVGQRITVLGAVVPIEPALLTICGYPGALAIVSTDPKLTA